MKALLLAAGLGTRLRPLTDTTPKCLVPIHGKPLLGYWLDLLLPSGIESVVINTHYLPECVRSYVAQSRWRDRITLFHEETLLGTGGTVLRARQYFSGKPFMVAHADNLTKFDVHAFLARHAHRPPNAAITMMTFTTDQPQASGIVVEDSNGIVQEFHEKSPHPPGDRANAAVYIFEPEVVDAIAMVGRPFVDLSIEIIPKFIGRIATFFNQDYHRDIGSPASLRKADAEYKPG